jgi:hypothetical protein
MEAGPAKYKYRGIDDLLNAVHGPLVKHGVTFSPHSIQMINEIQGTTRAGTTTHLIRAIVTYRIYGPAGDYIEASVLAEGQDSGDKAGNKLMSGALKYVYGQVLSIPFSMDDQDATPSEQMSFPHRTDIASLHTRLVKVAAALDKDVETITSKWRASNGALTYEEFMELPAENIAGLVKSLEDYASTQKAR